MSQPPAADPAASPKSLLRRLLIVLAISLLLVAIVLAAAGAMLYQAATAPLPEYEALLTELEDLQQSGELDTQRQEFESQVAALYSEAQAEPRWRFVVTDKQLNGWLAMQLPIDFPKLEKQGIRDPRVLLTDGEASLVCRAQMRGVDTIVSATVAPLVSDDGWVGAEIRSVRVGRLPLPVATLTEIFDKAIRSAGASPEELRYRWSEVDGNPVLMIDIELLASSEDRLRSVDAIEVRDGELYFSGVTETNEPEAAASTALAAPGE